MLSNVSSVNDFQYANQVECTQSDAVDIYFQIVDATKAQEPGPRKKGAGLRYVPASGCVLNVLLDNINDAVLITRTAVQAYPTTDPSIFKVSLLNTDTIQGTCDLVLDLNESGVHTRGRLSAAVLIWPQSNV